MGRKPHLLKLQDMEQLTPHINHLTIYAIILLCIGSALRYLVRKRRFDRRSIAGLQHFKSYKQALLITAFEKVIDIFSILLIIGAVVLFLIR